MMLRYVKQPGTAERYSVIDTTTGEVVGDISRRAYSNIQAQAKGFVNYERYRAALAPKKFIGKQFNQLHYKLDKNGDIKDQIKFIAATNPDYEAGQLVIEGNRPDEKGKGASTHVFGIQDDEDRDDLIDEFDSDIDRYGLDVKGVYLVIPI